MTAVETAAARCRRLVNELELQLQRLCAPLRTAITSGTDSDRFNARDAGARLEQALALCDLVATARMEGLLDAPPPPKGIILPPIESLEASRSRRRRLCAALPQDHWPPGEPGDLVPVDQFQREAVGIIDALLDVVEAGDGDRRATEAVYLFAAWLTTRDEVSGPFSSNHNANQAAELVGEFCETERLPDPRPDWIRLWGDRRMRRRQ